MANESRLVVSTPDGQGVWQTVYIGPSDTERKQFHDDGLCDRFCPWCWDEAQKWLAKQEAQ